MSSLDHPRLRAWDVCPLCAGRKNRGLVACWDCFNEHDIDELERVADNAERALHMAVDKAIEHIDRHVTTPIITLRRVPQRGEDIGFGPDIDADGYDWRLEDAAKRLSSTR